MGKHTQGDWSIDDHGDIVSGPYNVAIIYAATDDDKRLMAAASELLAAATAAEHLFHHTFAMNGTVHKQLRAAIAKATGAAE